MPIVVDPSFVPPPPPLVVEGPDGVLKVKLDQANAGVLLRADFSSSSPVPQAVRFYRNGELVRSGDPAWAPAGIAKAYDHEAPVGLPANYYAVPVDPSTLEPTSDPSDRVTVEVPWAAPSTSYVWLKHPQRPDLSLCLMAESFPERGRPFRTTFNDVPGARVGLSAATVTGGLTATLNVFTQTEAEYDALVALTAAGSVLLVQAHPDAGMKSFYARPTDSLTSTRLAEHGYGWAMRQWPLSLVEARRPATVDAPLRIPGLSWASLAAQYPTWTELAAQVESWDALIWGAV